MNFAAAPAVPYAVHRYHRHRPMAVIDMWPRRRSRWPQILLGLLILAVVYALLSRDERRSSWW